MAETYTLSGTGQASPQMGNPSGTPSQTVSYNETLSLDYSAKLQVTLNSDSPQSVPLAGMTQVSLLSLRATGGPVVATITSAAGTAQTIPVDPLYIGITQSSPITALSLTRSPGVLTLVEVMLGQPPS